MITHLYKASSPNLAGGAIYLAYREGQLHGFDAADMKMTPTQLGWLLARLPVLEAEIATANLSTLKVEPIPGRTAKDKIKMFCAAYRDYRNVTYQPTQTETSNIRTVPVSAELLRTFFESPLLDFRITNYVARINVTKDHLKNGRDLAARLPNYFDKDFYKACEGQKLVEYKQHLRKLGWVYDPVRGWLEPGKVPQNQPIKPT